MGRNNSMSNYGSPKSKLSVKNKKMERDPERRGVVKPICVSK